jgi:sialic acid synthase SpsE
MIRAAKLQKRPVVVAELGAKYAGLDVMRQMIQSSKKCGADMVKFQTYRAETIAAPHILFTLPDGSSVSQHDFFKAHELTQEDHQELISFCDEIGIEWFSTPSHPEDVELLELFDPICYKIGSDDLTNIPFLKYIADKKRPIVVSTGMSTLSEIEMAVRAIQGTGNEQIVLLHSVTAYPAKPEEANLLAIKTLQKAFGFPVGLSDHTQDEFTSILATQLGAVIIEKHFTLDHALNLPDHEAALDPAAFKKLVQRVRLVSQALGTGLKSIAEVEIKWRSAARKSIFAAREIRKGQVIESADLTIRRPGDGIQPHHLELVLGKPAACDISSGTMLAWSMF